MRIEQDKNFIVNGESYRSIFGQLGPEFCFFERDHHWPRPTIQADATGLFWILGMIDCQLNPLSYLREEQVFPLTGRQLIFFGTHSIIRWSIPATRLKWCGIISAIRPPRFLENEVWALGVDSFPAVTHPRSIFNFFCERYDQLIPIGAWELNTAMGPRIKQKIDQSYRFHTNESLIGRQLKMSEALITRYFKASYGITPVEYRNRKRIYDAVGLIMMTSLSIKEIALTVGFGEICRFNRNFYKYLNCCPSDFCHYHRKNYTKSPPLFPHNNL